MIMNRREIIKRSAWLAFLAAILPDQLIAGQSKSNIRIGACDWSLGMNCDSRAFEVARQIGLEGVQVNMGSLENNMRLRDPVVQQQYLAASKSSGIKIAGLAIGELNTVPYKSDPRTDQWVWDSVDVAKALGVKVILLAFFYKNDLRKDEAGIKEVIRKLKMVAPKAEKMGITLGIESYLNADEHLNILQGVGSESVKVYYDFRNTADAGYDVISDMQRLGRESICELHMKENGFLLGKGTMNWQKIAEVLSKMGYHGGGWMQIEGATPKDADIVASYKSNLQFLKSSFHY